MKRQPSMRCCIPSGECFLGYMTDNGKCQLGCRVTNYSCQCQAIIAKCGCTPRHGFDHFLEWHPVSRARYNAFPWVPSDRQALPQQPVPVVRLARPYRFAVAPVAVEVVEITTTESLSRARSLALRVWRRNHRNPQMEPLP